MHKKKAIPLDTVHIDHLGPLVKSVKRKSYLPILVDAFTKYTWAKPTRTLSLAETIENLRWIFGEFGYPGRVMSDRGLAFASKELSRFLGERGIKHVENSIATPRTNGQVERTNRTLVEAITASGIGEARWDKQLPEILWGINHTVNASTKLSLADILFSYQTGRVAHLSMIY